MSRLHLQDAIYKISTDKQYREQVKIEPKKLSEEFNLDESQIEVFFIDGIKKGRVTEARTCCCC
jgi:hypothetical protein